MSQEGVPKELGERTDQSVGRWATWNQPDSVASRPQPSLFELTCVRSQMISTGPGARPGDGLRAMDLISGQW